MNISSEGVIDLHGVDADVDMRGAEPRRLKQSAQRRDRAFILRLVCGIDQLVKQARQRFYRRDVVAFRLRNGVGGVCQPAFARNHRRQCLDALLNRRDGKVKFAGDLA